MRRTAALVRPNGPTFSGRAGDEPPSNQENRDARPVRCNGWLSRLSCGREHVLPSVENRRLRTERLRVRPSLFPLRFQDATSTAARRLDCGDVDLLHLHHRIERALGGGGIGIGYRFGQSDRRNLPGQSPFVLAPAARTLLAAVADDRIPVTIGF